MSYPTPNINYGSTVTIQRRAVSGTDAYGDDQYSITTVDVFPCSVQYGGSSEIVEGTDQLNADISVYVPSGTDVSYIDALLIDGVQYEVQGQPMQGISPFTGGRPPILIRANKVTGASV
jgi:hypothetical protein